MKVREESRKKLIKKVAELSIEIEKSPKTIERWVRYDTHLLEKKNTLKAIKKITGLTRDQIFEPVEKQV